YGLPVFQEFQRRFRVNPIPAKPGVLHALLGTFKEWQGNTSDAPRIAILDWREVPTFSEFVLFYDYFRAMGIEARIVDPREVEYRQTRIDGSEIDLVPWMAANKDRLVLKPNDDYGGKGIVLGWTVDQRAWDTAVQTALEAPYVVQQKVKLPFEAYPSFENN